MKVKDLKEYLNTMYVRDEDEVCIKLEPAGMGGSNVAFVKGVAAGFDWDRGKFIIYPKEELITSNTPKP